MKEKNIVSFDEFINQVTKLIKERMGEKARVDVHDTVKNNGVTYKAITVLEDGCNMSPNLRLEDFYEDYLQECDMDEIYSDLAKSRECYDRGEYEDFDDA